MDPAILEYSAPRPFFVGRYRYRTSHSVMAAAGLAAFAFPLGYAALANRLPVYPYVTGASVLFSAISLAAAGYLLYLWYVRREIVLKVTEEGVEYRGKVRPWSRITRIGGATMAGGITLVLSPSELPPLVQSLSVTPPLTERQFIDLMTKLQAYLAASCPGVVVDMKPTSD